MSRALLVLTEKAMTIACPHCGIQCLMVKCKIYGQTPLGQPWRGNVWREVEPHTCRAKIQ